MLTKKMWFDVITWADAKALKLWWNQHSRYSHHIISSPSNSRFFALVRIV